jgi:ribonuclease-3
VFEFLGDAVLGLALSEVLIKSFPQDAEGTLSKKRASLVNEKTLFEIALELNLDQVIRLGKGEAQTGGAKRSRLLASALEAIIGAIFLDSGFDASKDFVKRIFANRVMNVENEGGFVEFDFKTKLQEKIQKLNGSIPEYLVLDSSGPDHDKQFLVQVKFQNQILGEGSGKSKKQAEQEAAKVALEKWGNV